VSSVHLDVSCQVLSEDGERLFCRGSRVGDDGNRSAVLVVLPAAQHPVPSNLDRLAHEYGLKDELDGAWAVRPLELMREAGRTMLVLEDLGGEPLDQLLGAPMELECFLRLAVSIASALGKVHQRGLVHKDIKPANILVNRTTREVKITGFGIASRLSRERRSPEPPETIAGTLAYMAPEQTGRMNRSIDSRSDLYALGVTLYQMLTGSLPFAATDPMEWVHCHIARKPVPPSERLYNVPAPVSAIIMRLLVKTPEDRYQTATALERDLWRCLAQWDAERRIDDFPLGEHDMPDRLLIPEKLYGRSREVETLLTAFGRMVTGGTPELVLVSGYSGIGKSSVVNELHKVLVPPRGLYALGKCDQYRREIPYAALAQGFQSLVRYLLGKSDTELSGWRDALGDALGRNGRLMIDLVPELKLIIGDQPPVPELPPQDARRRFQVMFRRFTGVFAQRDHPLALFLDDLQWLDVATLDLLEDLLTQPGVPHLLLIGAYRVNEVTAAHPLTRKLEAIRNAGVNVHEIALAPLACEDVRQLVADALHCEPKDADQLARLVHEKTAGNPFFTNQFVSSLADEGMLIFDHAAARWSWDLERIHAKGYTDNVVDLMVDKLTRLQAETHQALQQLACLGNGTEIAMLSIVLGSSEEKVHADLWPAVRQELVERTPDAYRFVHDRVQEAAYTLIPQGKRAAEHLRIGRLLAAQTPPEAIAEHVFEIVGQFNRGAALLVSPEEREQVAKLNLVAGQRAIASTAYASALGYLAAGAALLPPDAFERQYELAFRLELHRAECEFLTGDIAAAENRLNLLSARPTSLIDLAGMTRLRVDLYTTLGRSDSAVEVCLNYLRHAGIPWSAHPTNEEVKREYERLWRQVGSRSIEELVNLPLMTDPEGRATMDVLTAVVPPAGFTDENLFCLVSCRMANLSLEHGYTDGSCIAYVCLGMLLGPRFGNYSAGFSFGKLGLDLVEHRELHRFEARVCMLFASRVSPWTQTVRAGFGLVRRAVDAGNRLGDLTWVGYNRNLLLFGRLFIGDPLADVQREAEAGLDFARQSRFRLVLDVATALLRFVRTLRGLTREFGSFNDTEFDESKFEQHLAEDPRLSNAARWYWVRKLQARFFAGDYVAAVAAASNARSLLMTPGFFDQAEYELYTALARAALCNAAPTSERIEHEKALAAHHRQLEQWAELCPANFADRAALVAAEIARLEGRELDAERFYEQAIRSAREHGFVQHEGLAYELAARFHAARGFEPFADLYLRNARDCYSHWGADGKVRQLQQLYPRLRQDDRAAGPKGTIAAPVEHLDLATVLKVSQAVSGEIVQEKLLEILMRTAIEQAGTERGLLVLSQWAEPRIAAQATTGNDGIVVQLHDQAVTAAVLPESIFQYVVHTKESVILDDAAVQNPFSADPYIRQHHARSILCMPLLNQGKLIGVLYLENNLIPRVFAPPQVAVLKLLAAQAAISLENARLYREVTEREAKIRRLVDSNIIGIFLWNFDGRIFEANDALLRMVNYDREDLVSGRVRWTDLTPSEWRERDKHALAELNSKTIAQPYEKEFLRKDGSRMPVLIGGALFEEWGNEGVAFVLDLTERKRAEQALQESEYKLRQIIDTVPSLLWSAAPDGEPTHVSQRHLDYSGMRLEDFKHRGWEAFVHPADFPETAKAFYHAIQTGTSYQSIHRLRRAADGEYRWHHSRGEPLRDRKGRIVQWYGLSVDVDEGKKAEDRLRRSEAYLAEAQRLSHTGSALYNETEILYWSEEAARIFGFDPLRGIPSRQAVWQRIHPDDLDRVNANIEHGVREKRSFLNEFRIILPDGTVKHVEATNYPVFSASGELLEIFATGIDVTERKWAEQALRESETKFRDYAETASDWFWETDPDHKFTVLTENAFGSRPADQIGRACWDHALDLETEPEKWRLMQATLDSRQPFRDFVYRGLGGNGSPMYVRVSGKPVFDGNGEFRGYRGTGTDVTEIMRAQEALRESERNARSAIDGIAGLVAIIAPNGEVDTVNRPLFEYFGRSLEWLKNWGTNDAVHPEDLPRVRELFERGMASGIPYDIELRLRRFDGDYRWFDNRAVPVRDDSGHIARWYVLLTDIEDRTRALARLEQMQSDFAHMNRVSMMGELAASLSHEITQPIASARNYARAGLNFLNRHPPNLGEVKKQLDRVVDAADRSGQIIERIRDHIKKAPPRKTSFDLNHAIHEVIALGRSAIAKNGVSVRTRLAEDLAPIQGDRVQVQQVVLNLVLNAVEAMGSVEEGTRELLISTEQDQAMGVLVGVRDSGPGIDPKNIERVFEAFYTTKTTGVGMGLSICRSIIDAHGGRLWATMNEPGGAVFQFTLPGS
jgi:PAS domain S-box-containing protein